MKTGLQLLLGLIVAPLTVMATEVKSPNGNVVLNFTVEDGRPTYTLDYKGKAVVLPSHLGLELAKDKHASMGMEERSLLEGFTLAKEETSEFDETWQPVWGETRDIRNHYNEYAATLSQEWQSAPPKGTRGQRLAFRRHERHIIIRFRVYDDGIGFRYEFPQQTELNYFLIQEEKSEFALAIIRPGGCLATTIRRNRRLRRRSSVRFAVVCRKPSTGATVRWRCSRLQVCKHRFR